MRGLFLVSENVPNVRMIYKEDRDRIAAELTEAADALEAEKARKDSAYAERNQVVAALARLFPSGTARTAIEGWSDDWHGCVYIDLPTGQVSWHFHDSQEHLFDGLPLYQGRWDGHDTPEKYRRLAAMYAPPSAQVAQEGGGVSASAYLAKIKADPRRAAALQRARGRAAGVKGEGNG